MTDLSKLSDEQLLALAKQYQQQGGPSASDLAWDAAQSGGIGLVKGGIGMAGLPGDLSGLAAKGIDAAAGTKLSGSAPWLAGAGDIQREIEKHTGEFYKPKYMTGEFAQTIGEFAPAALGGPATMTGRGLRILVPAVMSETAGQVTKGTPAEPFARIGGALGGGVGVAASGIGSKVGAPTRDMLFKEADKGYTAARGLGVDYDANALANLAGKIKADLTGTHGIDDTVADKTFRILTKSENPPPEAFSTFSNVDNLRKNLGHAADGAEGAELKAAVSAKRGVEDFMSNPPPGAVIRGPADQAAELATEARANSAAAHRAKEIGSKEDRAKWRSDAAHSGMNIGNTMRQRIADVLIKNSENPSGYNADELAQMEKIVSGTKVGNTARYVGNVFGGGGGLGQALVGGGAIGAVYASGDPRYLAVPAIGVLGRAISNASTLRQVDKLSEAVRSRSPLYEAGGRSVETLDPRRAALIDALIAAQSERGPLRITVTPQDAR